jgi:hypothetical protein
MAGADRVIDFGGYAREIFEDIIDVCTLVDGD